jgi:hypothetical protein
VLWARWGSGAETEVKTVIGWIRNYAGNGGRSLCPILETLSAERDRPVADAIAAACRRHIIAGHLAVAGRKLIATGRDTHHFTLVDGLLADGLSREYVYTGPRLANLARCLEDAGLQRAGLPTEDGLRFLEDHHVG